MPPKISYLLKQRDEKATICKEKVDIIRALMENNDRSNKVDKLAEEIDNLLSEIESISERLSSFLVEGDPDESSEWIEKFVPDVKDQCQE